MKKILCLLFISSALISQPTPANASLMESFALAGTSFLVPVLWNEIKNTKDKIDLLEQILASPESRKRSITIAKELERTSLFSEIVRKNESLGSLNQKLVILWGALGLDIAIALLLIARNVCKPAPGLENIGDKPGKDVPGDADTPPNNGIYPVPHAENMPNYKKQPVAYSENLPFQAEVELDLPPFTNFEDE